MELLEKGFEPFYYRFPYNVDVIVCAAYESTSKLLACVRTLRSQYMYNTNNSIRLVLVYGDGVDIDTVGKMFDLVIPENELCRVYKLPRGKLTARHIAYMLSDADIVVSADADCLYPPAWLSWLLKPYLEEENVVATHSWSINIGDDIWKLIDLFPPLLDFSHIYYRCVISARTSSMKREAYFQIGGFDLTKQGNIAELWYEEEHNLLRRLKKIGKVIYVEEAYCIEYNDPDELKKRGLRKTTKSWKSLSEKFISALRMWLENILS